MLRQLRMDFFVSVCCERNIVKCEMKKDFQFSYETSKLKAQIFTVKMNTNLINTAYCQ